MMITTDYVATADSPPEENFKLVFFITLVAAIGGFLFGFDSGVINGTVDGLQQAFNSDSVGTGFNVASMLLGCAVGAFFAGQLADKYGRRTTLKVAAIFFIISAYGSGIATSSVEFVIYRVLGGLAVGAASVMAPAYISEVTPARYRGAMTSINQVGIIAGLFFAFVSNYLLANYAGLSTEVLWLDFEAWRWMFWVEIIPAALFFVFLFFIPESPRYLVFNDRKEEAKEVLKNIFGEQQSQQKMKEISATQTEDHHRPRLKDLIDSQTGKVRKLVWVGIGLATFQQLVGINVVFYYGAVLWQAVGFSEADALLINILSGGMSILAVLITIAIVDKVGRKPILTIGSIGMAITLGIMALSFLGAEQNAEGNLALEGSRGLVALVAANAYVFFFNASWGPVMWVMLGEMFPNQLRGSGLAISGLSQWGSNFLITISFPILLATIGLFGAYGLYSLSAFISIAFVIYFVSETKGKELEEMASN